MKQILSRPLARYLLAGGAAYGIELAAVIALYKMLGLSAEVATAIAFWLGLIVSFWLQKVFAFQDYQKTLKTISTQITAYALLVGINYIFTLYLVAVFPDKLVIFSRTLALVITTLWNYLFYQYIFNQKKRPSWAAIKAACKKALTLKNKRFNAFLIGLLLAVPILLFNARFLASGDKIIPGDPDYYFQIYEAFRRSVLEFGQFPDLNGWVGGGIPLFANIQFGLISLQAPFVLMFGSVIGMKIAIVAYQLVCFFGFKKLFKNGFNADPLKATLLAYIPVFGSFFVYRIVAGHFTFLLLAFVPWLIYFYLKRRNKWSWLWFALIYSFMVWSSPHYTTIMSAVVVAIWFAYEVIGRAITARYTQKWTDFWQQLKLDGLFLAKAGAVIAALCAYRMYFVLQFIHDFPRLEQASNEKFTGLWDGLYAIWGPNQYGAPPQLASGWGWVEAATYIGFGTLICLILVLFVYASTLFIKKKKLFERLAGTQLFTYPVLMLAALFITFFILGMGDFGPLSPYRLLNHLPVFDSMRVSTRWLLWCSLCVLFALAAYKGTRFKKAIQTLLVLTVIELFLTGTQFLSGAFIVNVEQYRSPQASFNQEYKYRIPRPAYANNVNFNTVYFYDENLLETTRNNLGEVIAGDSLIDTRQPNSTIRCGENQGGCNFISDNAKVTYWSPNKIVLSRTAPGPINLNMNPGKSWRVNGQYVFKDYKIIDPRGAFIINDPANTIVLEYVPRFSPTWMAERIGL